MAQIADTEFARDLVHLTRHTGKRKFSIDRNAEIERAAGHEQPPRRAIPAFARDQLGNKGCHESVFFGLGSAVEPV